MTESASRNWRRTLLLTTIGGLAVGGLVLGGTALAATPHASHSTARHLSPAVAQQPANAHVFARNLRGLTYGSELDATTPADAPDLLAAYATNGKLGYVLNKDLHPQGVANPTAALQAQAAKTTPTQIPVYAVDGTTVIGVYVITAPSAGTSLVGH